jgi:hypothetical protein
MRRRIASPALPGRLVIDHNGKFLEPVDLDHPGFTALRRLLDNGRTWVKTSGVYETSRIGAPGLSRCRGARPRLDHARAGALSVRHQLAASVETGQSAGRRPARRSFP